MPKQNIFLFKLPQPTLILNRDPKSFCGIWKTQEGNVVSQCIYKEIRPVFAQKWVYLTPNSSNSRPKRL